MPENKAKRMAVDLLFDVVGSILYGVGIYTFALNADFATGGVSGVALIVNHFTHLPVGTLSLVMNLPILLVSYRALSNRFLLRSLRTMLISTFFIDLVIPRFGMYTGDRLLAAVFTGVFLGAGLAVIYMRGSSTGGADFLIHALKRKAPHLSFAQITLWMDSAVIACGLFAFGDIDAVLYGMISVFATTLVMDQILCGTGGGKMALIVTNQGSAIASAISDATDRGATLVPAVGSFSGKAREIVLCACSKNEIYRVRLAAHSVDARAVVMICDAGEVFGEGFLPPEIVQQVKASHRPGHPNP